MAEFPTQTTWEHPVTIEQMIIEGSCTAAWAQRAGYRWEARVIGGDALAKRREWLASLRQAQGEPLTQ